MPAAVPLAMTSDAKLAVSGGSYDPNVYVGR